MAIVLAAPLVLPTVAEVSGGIVATGAALELAREVGRKGVILAGQGELMKRLRLDPKSPWDPTAIFKAGLRIRSSKKPLPMENLRRKVFDVNDRANPSLPHGIIQAAPKGFVTNPDGDYVTDNYQRARKKPNTRRRPYKPRSKSRAKPRRQVRTKAKKPWRGGGNARRGASRPYGRTPRTYARSTKGTGRRSKPTWTRRGRPWY